MLLGDDGTQVPTWNAPSVATRSNPPTAIQQQTTRNPTRRCPNEPATSSRPHVCKEREALAMAKPFNGYPSWNQWNVALWIANDEPMYRLALQLKRQCRTLGSAARMLMTMIGARTPDGAKYNFTSVRNAIAGLE